MFRYLIFIIGLCITRFAFFSSSYDKKILFLAHYKLYFQAGLLCQHHKDYESALYYFQKTHYHKHTINCYLRLKDVDHAISLCKKYRYYKLGASICNKYNLIYEAAYFYSFFDLSTAITYYTHLEEWYLLGTCYLKSYQFYEAYDCFKKCSDFQEQLKGYRLVEEVAITLYLNHQFYESLQIFMYIKDYLSALECAKKLNNTELISNIAKLLWKLYATEDNYEAALYYRALCVHTEPVLHITPSVSKLQQII